MDCFPDFCLACDKQTMDGFYCSQACRLADLEKAGSSTPASPSTSSPSIEHDSWQSARTTRPSCFSLPPGFDFNQSKASTKPARKMSPDDLASLQGARILSPSTSRSSLSSAASTASVQTSQAMSQQAQHELNDYVSSFDAIREMKRRSLSSNSGH